jgi:acyl-CoA thioesterase-1
VEIPPNVTVLFQGDSITDADRAYGRELGTGYAMMVASWFSAEYTEKRVRFLNRGVNWNRIRDLKKRWRKDCLNLEPDIVSILIGINDTLGGYFWKKPTSTRSFEEDYRAILGQTRDTLGAKIILLSPFMLYVTKQQLKLKEDLNQKIAVVRELSKEFETLLVPLDRIFEEAIRKREPTFWSADGIHPTVIGHALIAQSWLKSTTI